MREIEIEKYLSKLLGVGAMAVTVFIVSGSVTDPVNVTKFLLLGALGTGSILIVLVTQLSKQLFTHKTVLLIAVLFIFSMVSAVSMSKSPLTQNLYGAYGRNNGLFTYIFLVAIFLSALTLTKSENFNRLIYGLIGAGIVNIVYCGWVLAFGDFMGWSNPYGNILGTLGNPNFIGAFLGIFSAVLLVQLITRRNSVKVVSIIASMYLVTWFEIIRSNAIQGRVVGLLGASIVLGFWLRSKYSKYISIAYLSTCAILGITAIAGALQAGPLAPYIYKVSVSLRGQYWLAGWNTGESHPFTGVGMDAFGDWYRRARDLQALESPGVNTTVNAVHNVPLDFFVFGGWPSLICYLGLILAALVSMIRVVARTKAFDPIFVSLSVAWVGYQVQSIISINQIGLAVWGWLLGGALLAYEKSTRQQTAPSLESVQNRKSTKNKNSGITTIATPISILGIAIGVVIALPPMSADSTWRSAQVSQNAIQLEKSLEISYFNPANTNKFLTTVQVFEQNQLFDQAHRIALRGVKWNPESFELWKVLYLIKDSTTEEKALALENMKRLDPLNPDVTSIK